MNQNMITGASPLPWRKSSYSNSGNCVEIAEPGAGVAVRDSKNPTGPALQFTADAWSAFLADVHSGAFDLR